MTSGVYVIHCQKTNKVYVGSSGNIEQRWLQHKGLLSKGKHHSTKLQRAWDKYGECSFNFAIVEESPIDSLITSEQAWIDHYCSHCEGYNILPIAGSTRKYRPDEGEPTFVKVRLDDDRYNKLQQWASEYGDDMSGFVRRMLDSLPDTPPTIPQPPVKP